MELTAHCQRYEGWIIVNVPEIEGLRTQAKRVNQVEAMVRDGAALLTGRPKSFFDVRIAWE
ncbi:MAG: hypothetical protein LBM23_07860 [Propionibacteriaceae bacterium]|nr:hypothetical protein [Propionibacteriaceae bacterium]